MYTKLLFLREPNILIFNVINKYTIGIWIILKPKIFCKSSQNSFIKYDYGLWANYTIGTAGKYYLQSTFLKFT